MAINSGFCASKASAQIFSYKMGNSFVHKCPAWVKIFFIPVLSICTFSLPPLFSFALIFIQSALCFYLKFSVKEQLTDLKPAIYYFFLLLFTKFLAWLGTGFSTDFTFEKETIFMLLKLFCLMQSSSIVFKTSTSLEIREGISIIEGKIRTILHLSKKNSFTDIISLFVNFIPMVGKNWYQAERAWFARGGKKSIKMYITLIPVLFSVGMKQAYNVARALQIRETQ